VRSVHGSLIAAFLLVGLLAAPAAHAQWWRDSVTVNGARGDVRAAPGSVHTVEPRGKYLMSTFGDAVYDPGPLVAVQRGAPVTFTATPRPRRVEVSLGSVYGEVRQVDAIAVGNGRYTVPMPETVLPVDLRVTIHWDRGRRYQRESSWSARLAPLPAPTLLR